MMYQQGPQRNRGRGNRNYNFGRQNDYDLNNRGRTMDRWSVEQSQMRRPRSRSVVRGQQDQHMWMDGRGNANQRPVRSSSCGPMWRNVISPPMQRNQGYRQEFNRNRRSSKEFHQQQRSPQEFHQQRSAQGFHQQQRPMQRYHQNWSPQNRRGRRNFYQDQGGPPQFYQNQSPQEFPQKSNYCQRVYQEFPQNQNKTREWHQRSDRPYTRTVYNSGNIDRNERGYAQERMIVDDDDEDEDDDADDVATGKFCVKRPEEEMYTNDEPTTPLNPQKIPQKNYVPEPETSCSQRNLDDTLDMENKSWAMNAETLAFIEATIPKEQQMQAKAAFEEINKQVITKITTFHCYFCSIVCRTIEDIECHKKTEAHIETRKKFLQEMIKTMDDEVT